MLVDGGIGSDLAKAADQARMAFVRSPMTLAQTAYNLNAFAPAIERLRAA